ncbi:MAG TPA: DMT family transporter [Bacteroidales bacterium]|nr:DMT family transporter [Bacteroidales bacterium]
MTEKKSIILGATAVSISAILWGFDGVVLTPSLYNLNVSYVVLVLHLVPFLIMNLFLYKQYRTLKLFSQDDFIFMFLVALFGGAIGTLSIVKALFLVNFQNLTIVVLLQKLQPIFGIALAAIFLKERLGKYYIIWASVAIAAGYTLTFGFHAPNIESGINTIYAAGFALLASFSFGSSTVFSKRILNRYNFTTVTFFRYGFTSVIMLLVVIIMGTYSDIYNTTPLNWLIFFIIAITTGSGAIFLYYFGLKRIKAIIAIICELLFPISAIIFDYIFNDSILSAVQWISAAVMIFAIINLNRKRVQQVKVD